jgi:hypothetical protein
MQRQPTLLNSCASAATAAEARFRIDYPDTQHREARVIALDDHAADLVRRMAGAHWMGGHFLVFEAIRPGGPDGNGPDGNGPDGNGADGNGADGNGAHPAPGTVPGLTADATLRTADGSVVLLSSELAEADSAVMIATSRASAAAASVIGDACAARRISSAGLVISDPTPGAPDSATGGPGAPGGDGGDDVDDVVAALRPNAMVLVVLHDHRDVAEILAALRV